MDYSNRLPPGYYEAVDKLTTALRNTTDLDDKKRLFDDFSSKFTTLDYIFRRRINLEIPEDEDPVPRDAYDSCLNLRQKALKHFYCPDYLSEHPTKGDELRMLLKMRRFRRCYRLQEAECLWSLCPTKFKGPFFILAAKKLEKYLIFPHSQLRQFYRFYQMNAATPLPPDVEEKYQKAVLSYDYMVEIAMEPEKWLSWMLANFEEKYFIDNFECKIGEHWFLTEIWEYYINYLTSKDRVEVLDIYRRYCRLFVKDEKARHNYFLAIERFKAAKYDITKWESDQIEMGHDFSIDYLKGGLQELLVKNAYRICAECFLYKMKKHFSSIEPDKDEIQTIFDNAADQMEECMYCEVPDFAEPDNSETDRVDDQVEQELADSIEALKSTKFEFNPFVTIRFIDSKDPPIPVSLFNYIIEHANHQTLSKLYQTCKYFYIRKKTLLCHFMYISQTYSQTFVKEACFTKYEDFINPNIKKYCTGISIHIQADKDPELLTKCLPRLCLCSLKVLVIGSQKITIDEFNMVISGGKIEQAQLRYTEVRKKDGTILTIEETIGMLPNVVDLVLRPLDGMYTPKTALELRNLKRTKKFESFKLYKIPENINILPCFGDFLKKFLLPKATLGLKLDNSVGEDFRRTMHFFTTLLCHEWEPQYAAPVLV